ncbi:MAG TPA: metallophosphoesterase [Actinomycetes bacterium]|nr:metallophosphoesterase [Actinomycetes bacterium]
MRVHVISDVHGAHEHLARAGAGADALICLGDLALFVDYADPGRGVFADLFGPDAVRHWIELRDQHRFDAARNYLHGLLAGLDGDPRAITERLVRDQYRVLFAALPTPTYLTYGNVDMPHLWPDYLRDGLHFLDGEVVELGGWRVGFVGGGLPTPHQGLAVIDEHEYGAKVAALGAVDVLASHIPPDVAELRYDTVARRYERGSQALLDAIHRHQPRYMLFGHVHNPLADRLRIGRTECVNVGHFAATGRPHVLDWGDPR